MKIKLSLYIQQIISKSFLILSICILSFFIKGCTLFEEEPVKAKIGMVVSANEIASKVGVKILKDGGNAIDAAVATGFALSVTYPQAGNIGGGGFMVIHNTNGKNTTIDFREKAPLSAKRDMYLDSLGNFIPELSQTGLTSTGVPGSVAGLLYALKKYGTMKLSEVIQPAIDLAQNGWQLDEWNAKKIKLYLPIFKKYPSSYKIFTNNGNEFDEGDIFKQPELAKTLTLIKEKGKDGFYKGKTAELIIKQIKEFGGYITQRDLAEYQPVERKPIYGSYKGYKIVSMSPPSSGGIALVEMLNIIENYSFKKNEFNSVDYVHKLVEAMKYAYADRTEYLGDDDFYPVPKKDLISKGYAKSIFNKINDRATPSDKITHGKFTNQKESKETTHFSVYDSLGNAVSVTTTLNSSFGNRIVVDGAGFLLNNEMDDFSSKPGAPNIYGLMGSEANSIQPGKRMLSSMTPTIVLKNEKPFLIVGSPGGSQIITSVLQSILNIIDFKMDVKKAIDKPRFHHQWVPDKIYYEEDTFSENIKNKLLALGYSFEEEKLDERKIGMLAAIMIENDSIFGAFDKRGPGKAVGY